jgi:hypothetical protein
MGVEGIDSTSTPQSSIGLGPSFEHLEFLAHFLLKHHENLLARINLIRSSLSSSADPLIMSESRCPLLASRFCKHAVIWFFGTLASQVVKRDLILVDSLRTPVTVEGMSVFQARGDRSPNFGAQFSYRSLASRTTRVLTRVHNIT